MLDWFIGYMRDNTYIDDETQNISEEQREYFEELSEKVFKYVANNHVPYDLMEVTTEFCVKGGILQYEDIFLAFELHHGQGTVGVCYMPTGLELLKISNFIPMSYLRDNKRHENYSRFRIIDCAKRINRLIDMKDLSEQEVEEIFNIVKNRRR